MEKNSPDSICPLYCGIKNVMFQLESHSSLKMKHKYKHWTHGNKTNNAGTWKPLVVQTMCWIPTALRLSLFYCRENWQKNAENISRLVKSK